MSDFTKLIKELEAKSRAPFPLCLQEWECTGYEHCELQDNIKCACGKHIAHVFEITNAITAQRINAIGSTCIQKFDPAHGASIMTHTKHIASSVRRAKAAAMRAAHHAKAAIQAAEGVVGKVKEKTNYAYVAKWTCFFKKHKGKKWGDLIISERGYCRWLLHTAQDPNTKFTLNPNLTGFLKAAISTQCERA